MNEEAVVLPGANGADEVTPAAVPNTPTLADRLAALVAAYPGSNWNRFGDNGAEVRIVFDFADGSRVAGVGINTAAAVANLEAKVAAFAEAMSNA